MEASQKPKHRTTVWPSNPTPGYISGKNENTNSKRHMHPSVHTVLFTIAKTWKHPKCPLTRWMDKEDVVYLYNGILVSHKMLFNT